MSRLIELGQEAFERFDSLLMNEPWPDRLARARAITFTAICYFHFLFAVWRAFGPPAILWKVVGYNPGLLTVYARGMSSPI